MYRVPARPKPELIRNEFTLQRECVNWLTTYRQDLIFTSTCGGTGSKNTHSKMLATGYLKGIPDLLILDPAVAIEFKWKTRPLRTEQKFVIDQLKRTNKWTVHIIRTYDEFVELFNSPLLSTSMQSSI